MWIAMQVISKYSSPNYKQFVLFSSYHSYLDTHFIICYLIATLIYTDICDNYCSFVTPLSCGYASPIVPFYIINIIATANNADFYTFVFSLILYHPLFMVTHLALLLASYSNKKVTNRFNRTDTNTLLH